jgi:multisubunit Na+/H+ antiporter MnhB subunit
MESDEPGTALIGIVVIGVALILLAPPFVMLGLRKIRHRRRTRRAAHRSRH